MEPTAHPTTLSERDAVAVLCLVAAQADGLRPEERARLADVFEALGGVDTARLFEDVMLERVRMEDAVAALTGPGMRAYALEMAVGACDADGHTSPAERAFLERLERALGLEHADAMATLEQAEAPAEAPLSGGTMLAADATAAAGALVAAPEVTAALAPTTGGDAPAAHELDRLILHRANLAGALELLPQSLATMAIVPVQLKTVWRVCL